MLVPTPRWVQTHPLRRWQCSQSSRLEDGAIFIGAQEGCFPATCCSPSSNTSCWTWCPLAQPSQHCRGKWGPSTGLGPSPGRPAAAAACAHGPPSGLVIRSVGIPPPLLEKQAGTPGFCLEVDFNSSGLGCANTGGPREQGRRWGVRAEPRILLRAKGGTHPSIPGAAARADGALAPQGRGRPRPIPPPCVGV